MNEKGGKRREWIKTAAIIFLSVLLALTFFSNTIQNYSLPEVATQYVESGTITAKIRGTGTVESNDPYNVMVKETRKVASVAVKAGDAVQQGDVLVYLEGEESTEAENARNDLEAAQDVLQDKRLAYERALLSGDMSAEAVQDAGSNISASAYRQQLTNAQAEVKAAQRRVNELQESYDALASQIKMTSESGSGVDRDWDAYNKLKEARDKAEIAMKEAQNAVTNLQLTVSAGDALTAAQNKLTEATIAYNNANTAFQIEEGKFTNDKTGMLSNLQAQLNSTENDLRLAKNALAEKQDLVKELAAKIGSVYDLDALELDISRAREEVEKARKKLDEAVERSSAGTVTVGVAGTVISISATAGKEISASEPVAVIQPEGKGYTMQFTVTNDQAKRLSVGDMADLVNAWRYDDLTVQLASIKPDPQNPGQQKLLTFDVSGSVTAGQSLNVSVGQKSANYDLIVPNSAVREDNNGKFILIVETKSSPLNNRYVATRVDVEVLASDDTKSAISGGLYGHEYVITTSTAPVEAGQLIRLADN